MSAVAQPVALERRKPPAAVRRRRFLIAVADHSLLIAAAIMFLAPFVFIVLTSLMTNKQALSPKLWPEPFRWSNYTDVFRTAPIWRYALNTTYYAVLATVGVLVSSIPVAYALSRLRWKGRDVVFIAVLVAMMLPIQITVVPVYVLFSKLHLVGSLWPLIIPNFLGDAFSIFLLRQFFLTIPEEYSDAARVDGWGVADPVLRVPAAGEACDRGGRALRVPLLLQRLLRAAAVHGRNPGTGRCRSGSHSSGRSTKCSGT